MVLTTCNETGQGAEKVGAESRKGVRNRLWLNRTTLDSSWLSDVRHPITGLLSRDIRPEESVGYFAILNLARELSPSVLKDAAKRFEREAGKGVRNRK
jgi:hypothetical protein